MLFVTPTLRSFIIKTAAADAHMEHSKTRQRSRQLHNYLWRIHSDSSERGSCLNKATQPGLKPADPVSSSSAGPQTSPRKSLNWFPACYGGHRVISAARFPTLWKSTRFCAVAADVGEIFSNRLYTMFVNVGVSCWTWQLMLLLKAKVGCQFISDIMQTLCFLYHHYQQYVHNLIQLRLSNPHDLKCSRKMLQN